VKTGADYIVVAGRFARPKEPLEACRQIVQEIAEGLQQNDSFTENGKQSMEVIYGIIPLGLSWAAGMRMGKNYHCLRTGRIFRKRNN